MWRIDNNRVLQANRITVSNGSNLRKIVGDQEADVVLASFVMHQIPFAQRTNVYNQLMQVCRETIHMGPIFGLDFDWLKTHVQAQGFEIVVCHPFQKNDGLIISNPSDCQRYMYQYSSQNRIVQPQWEQPYRIVGKLGINQLEYGGGSYMILRRK